MMDVRLHARVFVQDVQLLVMRPIVTTLATIVVKLHVKELAIGLVLGDAVVILDTINHLFSI